jgi:hypothetical protein
MGGLGRSEVGLIADVGQRSAMQPWGSGVGGDEEKRDHDQGESDIRHGNFLPLEREPREP